MEIKILHTADLHLDSPFDALPEDKAMQRRTEQRELLNDIAELAESERADIVLLAGDLLDSAVSYYETYESLVSALSKISGHVFISPGNHDWVTDVSPYVQRRFPENVHIFTSQHITSVDLPELGCRIYGAGFAAQRPSPILSGFEVEDRSLINIMVMHGDICGDDYNHIDVSEIAASGLDYLALGHIHTFSGIMRIGETFYAYPGCPAGRGFDETGDKGLITGTVSKTGCDLRFVPLNGRQYRTLEVPLTGEEDTAAAVRKYISPAMRNDIVRIVLTGETGAEPDAAKLADELSECFFHVTVRNETRPIRDMWDGISEDTLRGNFLRFMRKRFDAQEYDSEFLEMAVRYGLAALDNREEWRS